MERKILIGLSAIIIIVLVGLSYKVMKTDSSFENIQDLPVEKLIYENENVTSIITRNKITKEAEIEIDVYYTQDESSDLSYEDANADLLIDLLCTPLSTVFFHPNATKGFSETKIIPNITRAKVISEDGKESYQDIDNPFYGYKIKKVDLRFIERVSKKIASGCSITGMGRENITYLRQ